jgi:3-oxoacyl-(acyl-carrier-protein) synthase
MTDSRTVVITGIGIVGPTGNGHEALWSSLMEHRSGVRRLEGAEYDALPARHAAPIEDFDLTPYMDKRAARRMGRFAQFAIVAARLAVADAGLDDISGPRTGITIHTGAGGIPEGDDEVIKELVPRVPEFLRRYMRVVQACRQKIVTSREIRQADIAGKIDYKVFSAVFDGELARLAAGAEQS